MPRSAVATCVLIVGLVLTLANHVAPAGKPMYSVKVDVTSKTHEYAIKSYMHQALRALGDIEIHHDVAEFTIYIVHTHDEKLGDNAFSHAVLSALPDYYLNPNLDEGMKRYLAKNAVIYETSGVSLSGSDIPLKDKCENIVARIDGSAFDNARRVSAERKRRNP